MNVAKFWSEYTGRVLVHNYDPGSVAKSFAYVGDYLQKPETEEYVGAIGYIIPKSYSYNGKFDIETIRVEFTNGHNDTFVCTDLLVSSYAVTPKEHLPKIVEVVEPVDSLTEEERRFTDEVVFTTLRTQQLTMSQLEVLFDTAIELTIMRSKKYANVNRNK